jgi:hypothetical protein
MVRALLWGMNYSALLVRAWSLSTSTVTVGGSCGNDLLIEGGSPSEREAIANAVVGIFAGYAEGATVGIERDGTNAHGVAVRRLPVRLPPRSLGGSLASCRLERSAIGTDSRLS